MPTGTRQHQVHRMLGALGISTDHPSERARQPGESASAYRARHGRAAPPKPEMRRFRRTEASGMRMLTETEPRVVGRTLVELPDDTPPEAAAIIVAPPGADGEAAGRKAAAVRALRLPDWHHRHETTTSHRRTKWMPASRTAPDDIAAEEGATDGGGQSRPKRAHARTRNTPAWMPALPVLTPVQIRVAGMAVAACLLFAILVPVLSHGGGAGGGTLISMAQRPAYVIGKDGKPVLGKDGKRIAIPQEPGGGTTLFPSHRLVAFYGTPNVPNLGILGTGSAEDLWPKLAAATAPFATPGVTVVPSYELITYTAEAAPGPNNDYTLEQPTSVIQTYLQAVHQHGGMLILDIQPGLSSMLADAQALEPYLLDPDVGLALDPEWELKPGERPDEQVGTTNAAEINAVSTWLQQLTVSHHLPQKLLMVHQFQARQIPDKAQVIKQPNLAMMFNMDGFGTPEEKSDVYQYLATDDRFPLGYKLFYTRDTPMLTPQETTSLSPAPVVVEYE